MRSSPDGDIAIKYAKIVSVCPVSNGIASNVWMNCGFLEQSNISPKNIARLEILAQHASREVKDLSLLILEVARVKPHKRRRWKFLAQNHSELFLRLKALSGEDNPEADLSPLDSDILLTQHLESGETGIFHSGQHEAAAWENDPYWLVESED